MAQLKYGSLSDFFSGVGGKRLTEVEVNQDRSNQHEFQGVSRLKKILGESSEKVSFPSTFLWLEDDSDKNVSLNSHCTWSDVRRDNPNRSPEYHLYYNASSEPVVFKANAGDFLFIAVKPDQTLLIILCPADSSIAYQLEWLFGLDLLSTATSVRNLTKEKSSISYIASVILNELGLESEPSEPDAFDLLLEKFSDGFPSTSCFSEFARQTLKTPQGITPDGLLLALMAHEEALFRHLEKHFVSQRLREGFLQGTEADVDGFIQYSLGVQNGRKSRAGYALANHVESILNSEKIRYKREATTEKRNAADFLFPDENSYHNSEFPSSSLRMLAVKTSCKDRWRQVLAEANRISPKHLLTLEPAISVSQTEEMKAAALKLVLPEELHQTYKTEQRNELLTFSEFLTLVR